MNKNFSILFILGCVVALCYATAVIQYDTDFIQASLLFNDKVIVTFNPQSSLGHVITQLSSRQLVSPTCQMIDHHTNTVITLDTTIFDVFVHHKPHLVCADGVEIVMQPVIDPTVHITPSMMKDMREDYLARQQDGQVQDYPMVNKDMRLLSFDTAIGWAFDFIMNHWGPLTPFPELKDGNTAISHFNGSMLTPAQASSLAYNPTQGDQIRDLTPVVIGLAADWGAGTEEAAIVAKLLAQNKPDYTINLGDLYLVGSPEEAASHALGKANPNKYKNPVTWPTGRLGSFWYPGNHELYARGTGYYESILPTMQWTDGSKFYAQGVSYHSLENTYWRLIALDTGYGTYSPLIHNDQNFLPDSVMNWLINDVKLGDENDHRGVIIMTHHNAFSAFTSRSYLTVPQQLKPLIGNRIILQIWGHEHKTALYKLNSLSGYQAHSRCVGTSGFPVDTVPIPSTARTTGLFAYDDRVYTNITDKWGAIPTGWNGYLEMEFIGKNLTIEYFTLQWADESKTKLDDKNGHLTMVERFQVESNGNVRLVAVNIVDNDIKIVSNDASDPILYHTPQQDADVNVDNIDLNEISLLQDKFHSYIQSQQQTQRFTQRLHPESQFNDESAKNALKKYLLQREPHGLLSKAAATPDHEDDNQIAPPTINHDKIVEIDGHLFPHIEFSH